MPIPKVFSSHPFFIVVLDFLSITSHDFCSSLSQCLRAQFYGSDYFSLFSGSVIPVPVSNLKVSLCAHRVANVSHGINFSAPMTMALAGFPLVLVRQEPDSDLSTFFSDLNLMFELNKRVESSFLV